jgi:hypothetical protein
VNHFDCSQLDCLVFIMIMGFYAATHSVGNADCELSRDIKLKVGPKMVCLDCPSLSLPFHTTKLDSMVNLDSGNSLPGRGWERLTSKRDFDVVLGSFHSHRHFSNPTFCTLPRQSQHASTSTKIVLQVRLKRLSGKQR